MRKIRIKDATPAGNFFERLVLRVHICSFTFPDEGKRVLAVKIQAFSTYFSMFDYK